MSEEQTRHAAKMARRKAVQDAEVASKPITEKGLLLVHTGPGKGKTTAAFGLALRMLGTGGQVGVVQYIKGAWSTGERTAFAAFGDRVRWHSMGEGFTWETQDLTRDRAAAARAWEVSCAMLTDPTIDLLVLDELNIALRYEYLDLDTVIAALNARRAGLHVVVTGRNAKPAMIEAADLVTDFAAMKHHFTAGVRAQKGNRVLTRSLMFQGTGSDVGKSVIVAGLARAFADRGLRVRPFKPQNMSNNAAVTADGGEIGRAQALQARAARVAPSVHMNPVLLKPQSMTGAQVVVQGRVTGQAGAAAYQRLKASLMPAVLDSHARLCAEADLILVEGAGSASEVNLRANDIANMGFARAADVPVILIGDIDRGGVIASLVGTHTVLDPADAAMIRGFIVNRFRGDPTLFADGMALIAARTGWAPLGLVPHLPDCARLPAEDALALDHAAPRRPGASIRIAVPILPRIANFDDLDPLAAEPAVDLIRLRPGTPIPGDADLVILPGSKATIADLAALRDAGFDTDIAAHARRGGRVLGLCGGYQMLGRSIADPDGTEGPAGTVPGLALLDVDTILTGEKRLATVTGTAEGAPFTGYEMHMGRTEGPDRARPFAHLAPGGAEGATSPDGRISGTYVHGLFADDRQRAAHLARLGAPPSALAYEAGVEAALDALARHLEAHLDLDRLLAMAR